MTNDVYAFGHDEARDIAEVNRRVLGRTVGTRVGTRDGKPDLGAIAYTPIEAAEPGRATQAMRLNWKGERVGPIEMHCAEGIAWPVGRRGFVALPERHLAFLTETLPAAANVFPTGTVSASSDTMTVSEDLRDFEDDYVVIVAGAGEDGADLMTTITDATEDEATLADVAETSVTDAEVVLLAVADAWILQRGPHGRLERRWIDAEQTEPLKVPVVNRFQHITMTSQTLVALDWLIGEWQPYKMDCEAGKFPWAESEES